MATSRNLTRCYILLAALLLTALLYHVFMIVPLVRQEREMDERLEGMVAQLGAAGHGMNRREVEENIRRIEADIAAFAEIGKDRGQTLQFSPEVRESINRQFQLIDFQERRFLLTEQIRALASEHEVTLFEGWEAMLPSHSSEVARPYLLWAQLAVMDQLLRAAIGAGVTSVDGVELIATDRMETSREGVARPHEIPVRMQLTGDMESIHRIIMCLPLRADEMKDLHFEWAEGPKSSFFLSRFILKKSSRERADEVSLDFVAGGYLDAAFGL